LPRRSAFVLAMWIVAERGRGGSLGVIVYHVENAAEVFTEHRKARRPGRRWVNQTVLALGLTSLFTDISSEMITAILPLYLVFGLHLSPLVFGAVDGLYSGATAVVRLLGGFVADRTRRHKDVAIVGYSLSTLTRLGMILVGSMWTALAGLVLVDRLGKGIRTAPRDAMISLATPRKHWGAAFGVHRSLDMAGALSGPVLAFAVLAVAPGSYDAVFMVSFCAGLIGLGVIVLYLPRPSQNPSPGARSAVSLRAAGRLVRVPRMAALLVAVTLLSLATIGDAFVYLTLQDRLEFNVGFFPLLYVATALVFMLLAVPVGRLADRVGRGRVFVGGYLALLAVYAVLLMPGGSASAVAALVLLGAYYAATDGVLMALAGESLPEELRGSGMALVMTATSLARLASSVLFGLLWTVFDIQAALTVFAGGLGLAVVVAAVLIGRRRSEVLDADIAN
jgi:MFS family permease